MLYKFMNCVNWKMFGHFLQGERYPPHLSATAEVCKEQIAVMSDIDTLCYHVRVNKQDTYYWWMDSDKLEYSSVFMMVFQIFGATSSPSCSYVNLRRMVLIHVKHFYDNDLLNQCLLSTFYYFMTTDYVYNAC